MHTLVQALEMHNPVVLSPSYSGSFAIPYFIKYHEQMGAYVPVAPGAASTLNKPNAIALLKTIEVGSYRLYVMFLVLSLYYLCT